MGDIVAQCSSCHSTSSGAFGIITYPTQEICGDQRMYFRVSWAELKAHRNHGCVISKAFIYCRWDCQV
jgi:hypothetical protein